MRPHHLVIEGFGPFADRQEVDFDRVAQDGLFLITGPTGAGKTTILDALCFALFNAVPGPRGSAADLRSHLAAPSTPTRVELTFSSGGRTFRIERSPQYQRPRKRGSGMTTQNHAVALTEHRDGQWSGLTRTAQETQAFLDDVIGLTAAQFTKLVVLPQGDFAAFLHADPSERESILEKLFATQHFRAAERVLADRATEARRQTEEAAQERRFALETAAASAWEEMPQPPPRPSITDTAAQLGAAAVSAAELTAATAHAAQLWEERATAAEEEAADWRRRVSDQQELAALLVEEQRWTEEAEDRAQLRSRLRRARAADALRHTLRARADAQATAAQRTADEETARTTAQRALPPGASLTLPDLTEATLLEVHAHLERAAARIARSRELETQAQVADRSAAEAADAAARAGAELEALELRVTEHRRTLETQQDEAHSLETAVAAGERVREQQRLVAALRTATAQDEAAHSGLLTAQTTAESAAHALAQVRDAVRADEAARLATTLEADTACPVCGSPDHPDPARPPADTPAPEEVAAAEHAEAVARQALAVAQAGAETARRALADARDAAEDIDATALHEEAEQVRAAAERRTALFRDIEANRKAMRDLDSAVATARDRAAQQAQLRAEAATRATEARTRLTEAQQAQADPPPATLHGLGLEAPTTDSEARAAVDAIAVLRTAHARWVNARDTATAARRDARTREADLETALAESEFPDVAALQEAARLPLTALQEQEEALRDREHRLALRRETDAVRRARTDRQDGPALANAAALREDAAERARADASAAAERSIVARDRQRTAERMRQDALDRRAADSERLRELERDIDVAELVLGTSAEADSRMSLSSYALTALFADVAAHASDRLVDMTAGRYRLVHDLERRRGDRRSGLGLKIIDMFTDESRDPRTLSGGEGFMASLALALGLADTVRGETGGIELDALFLDEGFGTLDADTLSDVLAVLDRLRTGGRTVGIISHVSELQQAVTTRIAVEPGPRGARIRTAVALPGSAERTHASVE